MDRKTVDLNVEMIRRLIDQNKISAAITQMIGILASYHKLWELRERIERIETEYSYLKQYALDGLSDPSREEMYHNIRTQLQSIVREFKREMLKIEDNSLYYSTLRYEESQSESLNQLLNRLIESDITARATATDLKERENIISRIFKKIWVSDNLKKEDGDLILQQILSKENSEGLKQILIYSLFLSCLENLDRYKMMLLSRGYAEADDIELQVISLVCIYLILWVKRNDNTLSDLFEILNRNKNFEDDTKSITAALLRAGDTERISKKMHDDIIPVLSKLKPTLEQKLKSKQNFDIEGDFSEFNPDWENIFEEKGISDKIRELTELQSEGNDLMMVTFSHLKSFPFFNEISNWFLPFTGRNSHLISTGATEQIFELLKDTKYFCDNDKYSMALSISGIKSSELSMIAEQMKMQSKELKEVIHSELNQDRLTRDLTITTTIQNLYRFFKLFKRRDEFTDPFGEFIIIPELSYFQNTPDNNYRRKTVADFLFSKGYYSVALGVYDSLLKSGMNDNELYQKAAYCHQKNGNISEALRLFEISDLISTDNIWNLKRLGYCNRMLGKPAEALEYYKRILTKKPDDLTSILNSGYCELELNHYGEALRFFYKYDFMSPGVLKALRPIAWCCILVCDYDKAEKVQKQIRDLNPEREDFINMGHLAMIKRKYREAIQFYNRASDLDSPKTNGEIIKDSKVLLERGVDPIILNLVLESII